MKCLKTIVDAVSKALDYKPADPVGKGAPKGAATKKGKAVKAEKQVKGVAHKA